MVLEENMLSAFYYYEVSDIQVDGKLLDDNVEFNKLVCSERVDEIIRHAESYSYD